jgi:uncharacterized protein YraI
LYNIYNGKPGKEKHMKHLFLIIFLFIILSACSPDPTAYPYVHPTQIPNYISAPTTRIISPTQYLAPTSINTLTGCANGNPNVRTGPGTQYGSQGLILSGTCGSITGRTTKADWVYVQTTNLTGWIYIDYVQVYGNIYLAPVMENYSYIPLNDGVLTSPNNPADIAGCPYGCTYQKPGCDIKGNISYTTGEKIYHVPGQTFYNETVINPNYGERWFCTEAEAIANGWRKAKN